MLRALFEGSSLMVRASTSQKVIAQRFYATPGSKVVPTKEDKSFVDTDAEKLSKYVCINFYVQGEEPGPPIKPNSEYPAWLFDLDLRPPRQLEDLDPEKDGWSYWRELRKRQMEQSRRHIDFYCSLICFSGNCEASFEAIASTGLTEYEEVESILEET